MERAVKDINAKLKEARKLSEEKNWPFEYIKQMLEFAERAYKWEYLGEDRLLHRRYDGRENKRAGKFGRKMSSSERSVWAYDTYYNNWVCKANGRG